MPAMYDATSNHLIWRPFVWGHLSKTTCHEGVAPGGCRASRVVLADLLSSSSTGQRSVCRSLWVSDHFLALPLPFLLLSECLEAAEFGPNRRPFCNFNQDLESAWVEKWPSTASPLDELIMERGMEGWMNGWWRVRVLKSRC